MNYSGTLEGAEKLIAGEPTDLAWFSHGKYIALVQGDKNRILAQEKTMLSPVVLGVKESMAKAWGWADNPNLTWRDIAAKASSGELRYAMADPASSNSGFTALVGVATALSGSSDALSVKDIDQAQLGGFFKGQQLSAGSSGWLVELAFPNDLSAIDKLLFAYEDKQRRSSHAFFVLDVSGSMAGERMQSLQTALKNLTGQDPTLSGRFSRFRSRETLTFIPFDNQVYPAKTFTIADPENQSAEPCSLAKPT